MNKDKPSQSDSGMGPSSMVSKANDGSKHAHSSHHLRLAHQSHFGDAPLWQAPPWKAPLWDAPVKEAPQWEAPLWEAPVKEAPVEDAPLWEAPPD